MIQFLISLIGVAAAHGVSSETRAGPLYFEEALTGIYETEDWTTKLGASILKTTLQVANSAAITDQTTSMTGELGYMPEKGFGTDLQLDGSTTPAENLTNLSVLLSQNYRWKYRHHRSLNLTLRGGVSNFVQKFTSQTKKRNGKTVSAAQSTGINQTNLSFEMDSRLHKDFSLTIGFDVFGYNKSVGVFESQLDSPAALLRGSGALASTLGGFAKYSVNLNLIYDFLDKWSALLSSTIGKLAIDGSQSTLSAFKFETTSIENWTLSLGFESLQSKIYSANYAVFRVDYDF